MSETKKTDKQAEPSPPQAEQSEDDVAEEPFTILVEWPSDRPGRRRVTSLEDVQAKSQRAIDLAMRTIDAMAERVSTTIEGLEDGMRPNGAEVEFGVNLDAEVGALLAKASTGAQISVRLRWNFDGDAGAFSEDDD